MACPFFDKLAAEIRIKIYEYALSSEDDVPLVRMNAPRTSQQQDGVGNHKLENQKALEDELSAWHFDREMPFGLTRASADILLVNKKVYKEAIEVFYSVNAISIFTDPYTMHPTLGPQHVADMSLAKRLFVRLQKPMKQDELENFLARMQSDFPRLTKVLIHVDRTPSQTPGDALLGLANLWHRLQTPHKPIFNEVGSFSVEAGHGFVVDVEFEALKKAWRTCTTMSRDEVFGRSMGAIARRSHRPNWLDIVCYCYQFLKPRSPDVQFSAWERGIRRRCHGLMAKTYPALASPVYENFETWTLYVDFIAFQRK